MPLLVGKEQLVERTCYPKCDRCSRRYRLELSHWTPEDWLHRPRHSVTSVNLLRLRIAGSARQCCCDCFDYSLSFDQAGQELELRWLVVSVAKLGEGALACAVHSM